MKVLNYGSLNYDYVYAVDHMVKPGETLSADKMDVYYGGKGLNQSIALSRAGVSVFHAGIVGMDGDALLSACLENDIDIKYIKKTEGKCGHAIIQINKEGENSILLYEGTNGMNTIDQIQGVFQEFAKGDILLLQNEVNLLSEIIDAAYDRGMKIILNPSPFNEKIERAALDKVSTFLLNEVEGYQMTKKEEPEEILQAMIKRYPEAEVVLTLGKKGCVYQGKGTRCFCKSFSVKAVDTTAAGDTFTGYYVASLIQGKTVEEALTYAAAAAALAVTKAGASNSIPYAVEVNEFNKKRKSGEIYDSRC